MLHARTADNTAVTIGPNIRIKVNARHSIPSLRLPNLLGKPLPLPLSRPTQWTLTLHNDSRCKVKTFKS